jgi:hypothetical protein
MSSVWTGLGSTNSWSDAGNWSGHTLPHFYDPVMIGIANTAITIAVPTSSSAYAGSLTIGDGGTNETVQLNLAGNFSLNNGPITVASGANFITVGGTITGITGGLSVGANAHYTELGGMLTVNDLTNSGTLTLTGIVDDHSGNISGSGLIDVNGGTLYSDAGGGLLQINSGTPTFMIENGGTVGLRNPQAASSINFGAGPNDLILQNNVGTISTPITNFGPGDMITVEENDIKSVTTTKNSNGTYTITLHNPDYAPVVLTNVSLVGGGQVAFKTSGGNTIVYVTCFLAGTLIRTIRGEVAVEDLQEGDLVLTASGEAKPISWIGYRHVTAATLPDAHLYAPVCIGKDAIAPGKPARDLWVTPDHAIFVEGKLIPVKLLVNGTTIRQVPRDSYSFYHLELDQHDLLLAEGLEAESYLDIGASRQRFENNAVTDILEGYAVSDLTEQAYAERGCCPITLAADDVQIVWQALAQRAATQEADEAANWTSEPELRLCAAGIAEKPFVVMQKVHLFRVPHGTDEVVIASRAASPWQRRPWIDDRRRLGVAIANISCTTIDGACHTLALDGAAIGDGWHGLETPEGHPPFRWTNGAAVLRLPTRTLSVMLTVTGAVEYPVELEGMLHAA